ncbi:hypothetical protein Tco_0072321 [Tanacetum coccineum]
MEEDYKPAVQHQRRVNPKIHDVIKKEVKILTQDWIDPISDVQWSADTLCAQKEWIYQDIAETSTNCFLDDTPVFPNFPLTLGGSEKTTLHVPLRNFVPTVAFLSALCKCTRARSKVYVGQLSRHVRKDNAKALPTNDARVVFKFPKISLRQICVPRAIISDLGNSSAMTIAKVHAEIWRSHSPSSPPRIIHKTSGKSSVSNRGLKRILERTMRLKIFSGKLKSHWSGPFTITQVFPYCTVELSQANGLNFKVNGHRVKHYFGGDVPQLVVPDLQTFPMDQIARIVKVLVFSVLSIEPYLARD